MMNPPMNNLLLSTDALAIGVGFVLSLLAFSAIFGDHLLARLAQHILVGAAMGYLLVLAVQNILRPRLLDPLLQRGAWTPEQWVNLLVPLTLGTILFVSGLEVSLRAQRGGSIRAWQRGLQGLGLLVVLLMLAVGMATTTVGTIQGTILPQVARAGDWQTAAASSGASAAVTALVGLVLLLITTGVLLHLYVEPVSQRAPSSHVLGWPMVQRMLTSWAWLGKRALWLAAGYFFARMVAARLSLLIAQFEYFVQAWKLFR